MLLLPGAKIPRDFLEKFKIYSMSKDDDILDLFVACGMLHPCASKLDETQ